METDKFSEAVDQVVSICEDILFNKEIDLLHPVPGSQLIANLTKEMEQYYTTGNSGPQDGSRAKCVNPTLLEAKTGKWCVRYDSCPFIGYAPLPLKELDQRGDRNWIAFEYCLAELKKLLIAVGRRNDATFQFHSCDPLAFCYEESPLNFDIIDCSFWLADQVGIVNLLNAATRKLRSAQSILFTKSTFWPFMAPDVVSYLQTALCCPLSLIPTIYGLRLIDNVELGPDVFVSICINSVMPCIRLRWKKAQPFEGVALAMSPLLEQCLERLKKLCFPVNVYSGDGWQNCGMFSYSSLTFCYVLSDLIRREGLPVTTMEAFPPPSFFRTSMEANRAWMEGRTVWRVNVCTKYEQIDQILLNEVWNKVLPTFRLILAPTLAFRVAGTSEDKFNELFTSTESHFIDNLGVIIKRKENGEIDEVDISFLLDDRNLLKTRSGAVVDYENRRVLFLLAPLETSRRRLKVEKFNKPYPYWNQGEESNVASAKSSPADSSKKLMTISCQESQDAYTVGVNCRPARDKQPRSSGIKALHIKLTIKYNFSKTLCSIVNILSHLYCCRAKSDGEPRSENDMAL